jgi:hypothetical protein
MVTDNKQNSVEKCKTEIRNLKMLKIIDPFSLFNINFGSLSFFCPIYSRLRAKKRAANSW